MQFDNSKNKYAVGGYLTIDKGSPGCFLIEFRQALSMCEAETYALEESLQFVLEDIGIADQDIEFRTHSQVMQSWLAGDIQANWEVRFARNIFLNRKKWFRT